jgi:DNA-binding transcriptional ArsR family regulator
MDKRTRQLIDALEHPGAAILAKLVIDGPMTQEELLDVIDDASKSTMNRRLEQLGDLGLLDRAPGPRQYKNRPWSVAVPKSADSFLGSALALSRAIADLEEERRIETESQLRSARKQRGELDSLPILPKEDMESE